MQIDVVSQVVTVSAEARWDRVEAFVRRRGYTTGLLPIGVDQRVRMGEIVDRGLGNLFWMGYGRLEEACVALAWSWKGKRIETHNVPRAATGPDLKGLWIGAGGTLGHLLTASFRLWKQEGGLQKIEGRLPDAQAARRFGITLWAEGLRPVYFGAWSEETHGEETPFAILFREAGALGRALLRRTEELCAVFCGRLTPSSDRARSQRSAGYFTHEWQWLQSATLHPLNLFSGSETSVQPTNLNPVRRRLVEALR